MTVLIHDLLTLEDTQRLIQEGKPCCIAADESLLRQLPRGLWIGGTIPYFMASQGGTCSRNHLFVTELPSEGGRAQVRVYDRNRLNRVCVEGPEHGFSMIVLPAFSSVHEAFAQEAPEYEEMYLKPLVGWIAGIHLDDIGKARPLVIDGTTGELLPDAAVAIHVPLPPSLMAHVDIINLFEPGDGPSIEFSQGGFSATTCRINGREANLHDWMVAEKIDTRLPLVADYHGAMVNVSIKGLDAAGHRVDFYAPVFPGMAYHVARPVGEYTRTFDAATSRDDLPGELAFCCNCILNYAYGGLEGRKTGRFQGPMTFGEVGYQLLNQTLVHLTLVPT